MMSNHLASPGSLSSFCNEQNKTSFDLDVYRTRASSSESVWELMAGRGHTPPLVLTHCLGPDSQDYCSR